MIGDGSALRSYEAQKLVQGGFLEISDEDKTFKEHLESFRAELCSRAGMEALDRIAVATYDPETDMLKTFAHATEGDPPLQHYDVRLADVPSLGRLVEEGGTERVMGDLSDLPAWTRHTQALQRDGYRSSYTLPMIYDGELYGFVFFNSRQPGFFSGERLERVRPYVRVVALLAINAMRDARMFRGAARTAIAFSAIRDDETGGHLQRMAHYSRLTALELAERQGLSDEFVELVYQFAPLHDVGKIGVPDRILLKPGPLDADEMAEMRQHVAHGEAMVETMIRELGLHATEQADILRNIVASHHEAWDGSGYLRGLRGEGIPLEGRIVAVADVFDALTSERPYKKAWSIDEAVAFLRSKAGEKFDPECVDALCARMDEARAVRLRFLDSG